MILFATVIGYSNSLIGSRSSRMYMGRPLPLGNVKDESMPTTRYRVLAFDATDSAAFAS
jgi:hypothetical protein